MNANCLPIKVKQYWFLELFDAGLLHRMLSVLLINEKEHLYPLHYEV